MSCDLPLVLASASPQRKAILEKLNVSFTVRPPGVQELERGEPRQVALHNGLAKARAALDPDAAEVVLGVDTVVDLDGELYGKPADEDAAKSTLKALAGATHLVHSGVAIIVAGREHTALASTAVSFRELDDEAIERYVTLGEWRGRAGGYAIQGAGAALVRGIEGDYENVVGLPVATLLDMRAALRHPSQG